MWNTEANAISSATSEAIWKPYSTVETWPDWDHGMEFCRLEGPFGAGSNGEMMIKGAPAAFLFRLTAVKALETFSDETFLPGATVHFVHTLEQTPDGTRITHRASITGEDWERVAQTVGAKIERGLPNTVQTLARLAEGL